MPSRPQGSDAPDPVGGDPADLDRRARADAVPASLAPAIEEHLEGTRLAALFLRAPAFMAVTRGPEHVLIDANRTCFELVGGRASIGRPAREAFPELRGQGWFEALDRVFETGEARVGSEEPVSLARGEDGQTETIWTCTAFHPLRDDDGTTAGVLVHGIDVTERVRSRRSLERRSRQQAAVARLGQRAVRERDLPELFRAALHATVDGTDARGGTLRSSTGEAVARLRGEIGEDGAAEIPVSVEGIDDVWGELVLRGVSPAFLDGQDRDFVESVAHLIGAAIRSHESERFVDTIASNLPGILYRCRNERSWTMEYLSPGTEELTGYRPAELLDDDGTAYGELVHLDDRDRVWREVQEALDRSRPFQLQYRIRNRDGEIRWVWEQGRGVHPESGDELYLEGCIFDITGWRRAREESEIASSLLSATLRSIPDAIFVVRHPERRLTFCNPAAEEMFGYTEQELVGGDTRRLHVDPESYERFGRVSQAALEEEGVYRGEFRMRRADGTTFPTEHVVSYVERDGEPDYAVSVIRDVTERERREEALHLVNDLSREIAGARGFTEALETTLARIGEHSGWRYGEAWVPRAAPGREGDRVLGLAGTWTADGDLPEDESLRRFAERSRSDAFASGEGLPGRVWRSGEAVWMDDAAGTETHRRYERAESAGLGSALAVPVSSRGRTVAVLVWYDRASTERDRALVDLVETVASQLGSFLERQDVERSLRKSRTKFATAFQVNPMAMAITTLEDGRFLEVNRGFEEITGYDRDEILGRTSLEIEFWDDHRDRREVLSRLESRGAVRNYETRLRMKDGEVRNALYSGQKFELDGRPCLLSAAQDITQRKRFEEELEHQALHDGLTGLPNRTLLRDRLEQALSRAERSAGEVAVLFLDLDRFKVVNDTLGHPAGDELLRTVAARLGDVTRGQDTVARYGGDEFALLIEGIGGDDDLRAVTGRIRNIFDAPITVGGTEIHASASIGVAVSGPERRDPDDLIRYADIAMYRIKAPDSTAVHVFDPGTDDGVTDQLHQENELRRAVKEEEFVLHYQPVLSLATRSVIGAEALVRWDHPEAGLVPPGEFIPLAEETGLIVPLGEFVLGRAARTAVRWMESHGAGDDRFRVSVNLSARQHREEELPARIRTFAHEADLPLDRLTIEITESVLMSGRSKLQELRTAGLKLAIDDFGTGYSSLQYLRSLEADILKIDRGFVADVQSPGRESVIVQAILMMARQFGMEVVAEGVETERQARHLEELGCHYAQGFHFARPMPAGQFEEEWLAG